METTPQARLIVLEGLDGAGKSTLAAALAAELGALLLSTPPGELQAVRPTLDACYGRSGLASTLFYASTVAWASEVARTTLAAGRSVVLDRYWLSTRVYGRVVRQEPVPALDALFHPADLTVFVDAAEATRRQRMEQRRVLTEADEASLRQGPALRAAFLAEAQHRVAGRFVHLDTTPMDTPSALRALLQEVAR